MHIPKHVLVFIIMHVGTVDVCWHMINVVMYCKHFCVNTTELCLKWLKLSL